MRHARFHAELRELREPGTGERMTVERLANLIFSHRTHLTLVLNGDRPGGQTWRKIERCLERTWGEEGRRVFGTLERTESKAEGKRKNAKNRFRLPSPSAFRPQPLALTPNLVPHGTLHL